MKNLRTVTVLCLVVLAVSASAFAQTPKSDAKPAHSKMAGASKTHMSSKMHAASKATAAKKMGAKKPAPSPSPSAKKP